MFAKFGSFGEIDAYFPMGKGESALYMLVDPGDHTVRYIGVCKNPRTRFQSHLLFLYSSKPIREWIKLLRLEDSVPDMRVVRIVRDEDKLEAENRCIARYRKSGYALLNVHPIHSDNLRRLTTVSHIKDAP